MEWDFLPRRLATWKWFLGQCCQAQEKGLGLRRLKETWNLEEGARCISTFDDKAKDSESPDECKAQWRSLRHAHPWIFGGLPGVVGWVVVKTWQDGDQEAHTRFAVGSGTQVALQYFSWPLSQATQILRINHFGNPMLHPKGEVFPPSGLGHSHFDGASL